MSGRRMETLGLQVTSAREKAESSGPRLEQERKAAQQANANFLKYNSQVMQLSASSSALEEEIAELRAALAEIQGSDDDSGGADSLRAQIQAQIAQLESEQNRVQQRLGKARRQAAVEQQNLAEANRQIQVETDTLLQTRSSLVQMDGEYAAIIQKHRAVSSQMSQIGSLRYGGSGQRAAQSMDQVIRTCTEERSRIAQIQAQIARYLRQEAPPAVEDGAVDESPKKGAGAATVPETGQPGKADISSGGPAPTRHGVGGAARVAEPQSAEYAKELDAGQQSQEIPFGGLMVAAGIGGAIGGLIGKISRKKKQEPEPEVVKTFDQDRKKFTDQIKAIPDDKYAEPISPRRPGGDPVKGVREQSLNHSRDSDEMSRGGQSPLGSSAETDQQDIHWSESRTELFQKPDFIPENWKRIEGPHDAWKDAKLVNPLFKKKMAARFNCQRCVIAGEMRRRGYDVEATLAKGDVKYIYDEESDEIVSRWDGDPSDELIYNKGKNSWTKVFKDAVQESCAASSGMMSARNICKKMAQWGDGARAIVSVMWVGMTCDANGNKYIMDEIQGKIIYRDIKTDQVITDPEILKQMKVVSGLSNVGHVILAEQINGKTHFFDEQLGKEINPNVFFRQVRAERTGLMRVDNLEPTELVLKCCQPRKERREM